MATRDSIVQAILALCLWSGAVIADTYSIGPGDTLELRVLEWQPLENRVLEWESMRAEMAVDTDGMVNVPFLGQIKADLLSPAQLSQDISEKFQQRFTISNSLDAAVQVLTYRPVYVSADIPQVACRLR
jgi:protein involved in polysaccharide export with SLBB domain